MFLLDGVHGWWMKTVTAFIHQLWTSHEIKNMCAIEGNNLCIGISGCESIRATLQLYLYTDITHISHYFNTSILDFKDTQSTTLINLQGLTLYLVNTSALAFKDRQWNYDKSMGYNEDFIIAKKFWYSQFLHNTHMENHCIKWALFPSTFIITSNL
jgi:hypothetical protein